jgi:hypothetical protein
LVPGTWFWVVVDCDKMFAFVLSSTQRPVASSWHPVTSTSTQLNLFKENLISAMTPLYIFAQILADE